MVTVILGAIPVVINKSCIMVDIYSVIAFIIRDNTKNYVVIVLNNREYENSVVDIGYDFMNVLHTNLCSLITVNLP